MGPGLVRHFTAIGEADCERLVAWLPAQSFPYHCRAHVDAPWVRERIADGSFFGYETRSFWMLGENDVALGLVRVTDVHDITPLLDLRVAEAARGQGVGSAALHFITRFVFESFPEVPRIGGYTRHDNRAMQRVFEKCGFEREAYHRSSWRVEGAPLADSVGYALLRRDWRG